MNNNNNINDRNIVFSRVSGVDNQNGTTYGTGQHLNGETATTICIDGVAPLNIQQQQQQLGGETQRSHLSERTTIDMEQNENNSESNSPAPNHSASMQQNFITFFNEARSQFGRQTSIEQDQDRRSTTADRPQFSRTVSGQLGRASDELARDGGASEDIYAHSLRHSSTDASFPTAIAGANSALGRPHIRSWRMNLNNVLSFSSAPSTTALRTLISQSGGFRYTALGSNDSRTANAGAGDNIQMLFNPEHQRTQNEAATAAASDEIGLSIRISRSSSLREESSASNNGASGHHHQQNHNQHVPTSISLPVIMHDDGSGVAGSNRHNEASAPRPPIGAGSHNHYTRNPTPPAPPTQADIDEGNNVISDIFVKMLSQFMRYLPFVCILFVKFIHDHMLGILDLVTLYCCIYQLDKSLREQIAKFSQKSYGILLRDFCLVTFVVTYRLMLASTLPDPFGLLIPPPVESVTIEVTNDVAVAAANEKPSATEMLSSYFSQLTAKSQQHHSHTPGTMSGNSVTITKPLSLGVLLYYVAVNDLIIKLLTIMVKIPITMMPATVIRHKQRARMYALVEYLSQFYRACAPLHHWLLYLFESYSGLEVISGILFSSFYMGAKGFELAKRGKSLRKAILNFIRNMDYERKPTKDELDAAGSLCPICHDTFKAPVVLECCHIFCDDCVNTWFKREQTCPMCRAKVSEDPAWQDGAMTFFYQLC